MNKRALPLIIIIVPALLAGCAIGYQASGSLSDVAGEMRGKGYPGNVGDGGRFALADRAGDVQCDGRMRPADNAPNSGSCAGESGPGIVRCTDGREIPVRWTAITCRSFEGSGEDKSGNRLIFRVDRSK